MSRSTAAQVISLGEYLNPDFDPASLTVPQLLGILGFHNIKYQTPYTKPKLVQQFNDEVKPRSEKFKRERLRKENSLASNEGIMDGVTGRPIGGATSNVSRRSSRRLSRAPTDQETSPVRTELSKRRRSSAQPTLGGFSRKAAVATQPGIAEESESEDVPVRKVGRSKKSTADAGSQARRVSQFAEDSGWEDNNIFQSGAESSSPARPPTVMHKSSRKSLALRKSRKSTSAPPQMSPNSSPTRAEVDNVILKLPSQPNFEPRLPRDIVTREKRPESPITTTSFAPIQHQFLVSPKDDEDELDLLGDYTDNDPSTQAFEEVEVEVEVEGDVEEQGDESVSEESGFNDEEYAAAVSSRIANGSPLTTRRRNSQSKPVPLGLWLLLILGTFTLSATILNYKQECAPIGYCDTGKNTNAALEALKEERNAIEICNRENQTLLYPNSLKVSEQFVISDEEPLCPPLPLIPIPICTPCPKYATCTQDTVTCNSGYLLRPHPFLSFLQPLPSRAAKIEFSSSLAYSELIWKMIAVTMDGLPGLGPVAFPPRCREDPKRKRNIGVLGKAIEATLGQERGRRLCASVPSEVEDRHGGEARRWGVELKQLREAMKKKTAPHLLPTFEDTFHEAIQQLILWGGVVIGEDSDGKRYLAHQTPDLTWNCAVTVKFREAWAEWRGTVIGAIGVIVIAYLGKLRGTRQRIENKRVAELVQIALDTLRNQELAHHTDPVTAPQPYLSSLQLRDLILQHEHSIPIRKRLWEKVERVVEGNANVRVNLEEVHGGDEMRVWRWVGGSGLRKRVQVDSA